jgi:DNA-binding LytR/AlgR family response regulator
MKSIESHLPANLFLRIHRSFVVNMERITAIERGNVLIGEKSLPISDSYRDKVSEYVNQRLIVGR